ncbi:hypothetical protein BDFG_02542 [Blastomyces dermatitidis ATCC 26199]|nr:hypothetical protein BDFG_02542 [Blastomyces dermatitidis ATCC 26199]
MEGSLFSPERKHWQLVKNESARAVSGARLNKARLLSGSDWLAVSLQCSSGILEDAPPLLVCFENIALVLLIGVRRLRWPAWFWGNSNNVDDHDVDVLRFPVLGRGSNEAQFTGPRQTV